MQCRFDFTAQKQNSHMKYKRKKLLPCKSHQMNKLSDWHTLLFPRRQQQNFNLLSFISCLWNLLAFRKNFSSPILVVELEKGETESSQCFAFCLCLLSFWNVFFCPFFCALPACVSQVTNKKAIIVVSCLLNRSKTNSLIVLHLPLQAWCSDKKKN